MIAKQLFATCLLFLAAPGWSKGQEASVSLKESNQGIYALEGHFFVEASTSVAWNVLTDYDHVSDFVSSIEFSRVKHRSGGDLLVEQRVSGRFFLFYQTANLLLKIRETPYDTIEFEDTSLKDFDSYVGSWKIERKEQGVHVTYRLDLKSKGVAPGFIKKRVVKRNVRRLLEQVKSEITKRAMG